MFADRPVHAAGHVLTSHFIKEWDEGADSFAKSPPNATISVFSNDGSSVKDAVISMKINGDDFSEDGFIVVDDRNCELLRVARAREGGGHRNRR